jgi:hypothetical protein
VEEGGNRILEVEAMNSVLNRQLMVVLLGTKNTNIQRLEGVGQVRREIKELDMILRCSELEFIRYMRFMAVKQ